MPHSAIRFSPTTQAWDRLFAKSEHAHAALSVGWHQRDTLYRNHDRLHVLFGHLDPGAVSEAAVIQRLVEDGTDGVEVLRLWAAWKQLRPTPNDPPVVPAP